jgi:Zn-dependent peptidase ImmA (M78 family)
LQGRIIYVSEKEHPRRQTFTIAHELGHALLHGKLFESHPEDYQVLLRTPIGATKDPLEQEANAFAGHLLVPASLLAKYQRIADNSELARLFNVSEDVIRYRKAFESRFAAA